MTRIFIVRTGGYILAAFTNRDDAKAFKKKYDRDYPQARPLITETPLE